MSDKTELIFSIAALVIVLFVGGAFLAGQLPSDDASETDGADTVATAQGDPIEGPIDGSTETAVGSYVDYNPELIQNLDDDTEAILFFAASWCVTCRALEADILANLDKIPENIVIAKVDFDNNRELRNEYDIRVQHTLVQIDNNGDELQRWAGVPSLERIVTDL